jgi:hypothetical protein
VLINPTSLGVNEGGTSDTYAVVLNSQPTADVTISIVSGDTDEATVSPDTLTFTPTDWDSPQIVTVTGVDDTVDDGDQTVTISHTASSSDSDYDGISIAAVTVTVQDDDGVGVLINPTSLGVNEGGTSDTYTVVLTSQPTADVTISIVSGDTDEATVSPDTLMFTPTDWDSPQIVTVTGVDDTVDDGDQTVTISHTASSSDSDYNGSSIVDVTVTVQDDDGSSSVDEAIVYLPLITR